jgi:hypothetical protein
MAFTIPDPRSSELGTKALRVIAGVSGWQAAAVKSVERAAAATGRKKKEPPLRGHAQPRGRSRLLRARTRLAPLARAVGRGLDLFPATPLGLAVGAVAAFALLRFGRDQLDLVLLVASLFSLFLVGLALLFVIVTAIVVKARHRPPPLAAGRELETGRFAPTGFRPIAPRYLPLVELGHSWAAPLGVETRVLGHGKRAAEEALASRRGEHSKIVRRVVVRDVFGLASLAIRVREETPTRFLPHMGALARLPVLSSLARGEDHPHPMGLEDGDRVELRRYAPGDPARFIHWKVYGRTRRLMVRVPERALAPARRTAAFLISAEGDEASAGAARVAVRTGALGDDFRFAADGSPTPVSSPEAATLAIVRSADHRSESGRGLAGFIAAVERDGPVSLLVFGPPLPGEWVARVVDAARRRRGPVRAVIGVDGVAGTSAKRPLYRRLLLREAAPPGVPRQALDEVLRALAAAGVETWVVDRVTGRVVTHGGRAGRGRVAA